MRPPATHADCLSRLAYCCCPSRWCALNARSGLARATENPAWCCPAEGKRHPTSSPCSLHPASLPIASVCAGGSADAGRQGRPEGALAAASPDRRRRRRRRVSVYGTVSLDAPLFPPPLSTRSAQVYLLDNSMKTLLVEPTSTVAVRCCERGAKGAACAQVSSQGRVRCAPLPRLSVPPLTPFARACCRTRAGRWPKSWARPTPRTTRCACR